MNFANLYTVKNSISFDLANYLDGNLIIVINLIVNQSSKFVVSTFMRLNQ